MKRSYRAALIVGPISVLAGCRTGSEFSREDSAKTSRTAQPLARSDGASSVRIVDDGSGARVVPPLSHGIDTHPEKRPVTPQKSRSTPAVTESPRKKDWRAELFQRVSGLSPDQLVRINLHLESAEFDWEQLNGVKQPMRQAILSSRKGQLSSLQNALVKHVQQLGATEIEQFWLTNSVSALLPAAKVAAAISHPAVSRAVLASREIAPGLCDGRQSKVSTRILTHLYGSGITGQEGGVGGSYVAGHETTNITLGVMEADNLNNYPYREHVGFGGRLLSVDDCTSGSCLPTTKSLSDFVSVTPQPKFHGNWVLWVAGGSIEHGEDPAFSGIDTTAQEQQSGHLKGAGLRYYFTPHDDSDVLGLQQAVEDELDVLNISFGWDVVDCADPSVDSDGNSHDVAQLSEAIASTVSAGVVVVVAAGNTGDHPPFCTLCYPALSREVLTVGAMGEHDCTDTDPLWGNSSKGPVPVTTFDGDNGQIAGVDLIAPSTFSNFYVPPGNSYDPTPQQGTSLAAPVVTAMVGGLKDALTFWQPVYSSRVLMASALLFGDGYTPSGSTLTVGMDPGTGAGRAKMRFPSDLVPPFSWSTFSFDLYPGDPGYYWDLFDIPAPGFVTQCKLAVVLSNVDGSALDLHNLPDPDMWIYDTCSGNPYYDTIRSDTGWDVRSTFRLSQSEITGKCLQFYATAHDYAIPPSGVKFSVAYYCHSGDPTGH